MRFLFLGILAQLALGSPTALAALVIEFGPTLVLSPNSSASMDVFISSDAGDADFAFAEYRFDIALTSGLPTGVVRFLPDLDINDANSAVRQTNSEQLAANYVFSPIASLDNFVAIRQFPNTVELFGGDSTFDVNTFSYSNITVGSDLKLLARLEIEQFQLGVAASGTYQISLVQAKFQNADQANVFDDSLGFLAFTSSSGTIQVGASAVPEPSSMILLAGALGVAGKTYRRRRISTPSP